MGMEINLDRLMTNLFEMAKIGMNEQGGIDRALGSQADYETRQWLLSYWERNFNIHPVVDPIANMWVKREGSEPLLPIVLGSHHDAVPDGGKYDGAMGVPITFLDKYNPQQFEILDARKFALFDKQRNKNTYLIKDANGAINGKPKYARILIRKKEN